MGLLISSPRVVRTWWSSSSNVTAEVDINDESDNEEQPIRTRPLSRAKARELEEFRQQLAAKREIRKRIISEKSMEMQTVKQQLDEERCLRAEALNENKLLRAMIPKNSSTLPNSSSEESEVNAQIKEELEAQIVQLKEENRALKCEVSECHMNNTAQSTDMSLLSQENVELRKHVQSLKDINKATKEMMAIRESQLSQLKEKLVDIEKSLADREARTLSSDLRMEYERQLQNIRNLRILYEERARVAELTRLNLVRDLEQQKSLTDSEIKKCGELETRVEELEKEISDKNDTLHIKENQLGLSKAETKDLRAEMAVINQLFSQMLLGYNTTQDLDKLIERLEENHDLLTEMVVREDCSEVASALPKLILELLSQVDAAEKSVTVDNNEEDIIEEEISDIIEEIVPSASKALTSAEEIVGNLPKVWKVLMELLSHQVTPHVVIPVKMDNSPDSCYKSIETPAGPRMVPSVSKTYIRLKDLILEKKSLQKEMNRLKQLNGHLENRLQDQERRLGLVSSELNKTWHIVGKMQRQHQQFHTQEQILRFELQQKRQMLKGLRVQLELCKEKWDEAKQKNSQSQVEWDKLREEISSRKIQSVDNSGESGYSDERPSDEDESENEKKSYSRRTKKKRNLDEIGEDVSKKNSDQEQEVEIGNNSSDPEGCVENVSESKCDNEVEASSSKTYEEALAARSVRLKKLEEQCYVLVNKVTKTNSKGVELCNRLEQLHNQYGGSNDEQGSSENVQTDKDSAKSEDCVEDMGSSSKIDEPPSTSNKEEKTSDNDCAPSTSTSIMLDIESRFAARDERLKKMEEQAKTLVEKVSNTSNRGDEIRTKLIELHNTYGRSEEKTETKISEEQINDMMIENPTKSSLINNEQIKENDIKNDDEQSSVDNSKSKTDNSINGTERIEENDNNFSEEQSNENANEDNSENIIDNIKNNTEQIEENIDNKISEEQNEDNGNDIIDNSKNDSEQIEENIDIKIRKEQSDETPNEDKGQNIIDNSNNDTEKIVEHIDNKILKEQSDETPKEHDSDQIDNGENNTEQIKENIDIKILEEISNETLNQDNIENITDNIKNDTKQIEENIDNKIHEEQTNKTSNEDNSDNQIDITRNNTEQIEENIDNIIHKEQTNNDNSTDDTKKND